MEIASVYTPISGVRNLQLPDTNDTIETSHLTSGEDKTFNYGLGEGEISFEINYDRGIATHAQMEDDKHSKTARAYRVTHADGETDNATYLVTNFAKTFDHNDIQKAAVTLKRSGTKSLS